MANEDSGLTKNAGTNVGLASATNVVVSVASNMAFKVLLPVGQFALDVLLPSLQILASPLLFIPRQLGNLLLYPLVATYALTRAAFSKQESKLPFAQRIKQYWNDTKKFFVESPVYKAWQSAKEYLSVKKLMGELGHFVESKMGWLFEKGSKLSPNTALTVIALSLAIAPLTMAFGVMLHINSFHILNGLNIGGFQLIPALPEQVMAFGQSLLHGIQPYLPSLVGLKALGSAIFHTPIPTVVSAVSQGWSAALGLGQGLLAGGSQLLASFLAAPIPTIAAGASTAFASLPTLAALTTGVVLAARAIPALSGFGLQNLIATVLPKVKLLMPVVISACWDQAKKTGIGSMAENWYNHVSHLDVVKEAGTQASRTLSMFGKYPLLASAGIISAVAVGPLSLPSLAIGAIITKNAVKDSGVIPATIRAVGLENYFAERTARRNSDKVGDGIKHIMQEFDVDFWIDKLRKEGRDIPLRVKTPYVARQDAPEITNYTQTDSTSNAKAFLHTALVYGGTTALSVGTLLLSKEILLEVGAKIAHSAFGAVVPAGHEIAYYGSLLLAAGTAGLTTLGGSTYIQKAAASVFGKSKEEVTHSRKVDNAQGRIMMDSAIIGAFGAAAHWFGTPLALTVLGTSVVLSPLALGIGVTTAVSLALPSMRNGIRALSQEYHRTSANRPTAPIAASSAPQLRAG